MAFDPSITACLQNSCSTITVTDTTGVYDATTNPGGWGDASTILRANLGKAELIFTFANGTTHTEDVTSQVPNPVTGEFSFNSIDISNYYTDGIMKITYRIEDTSGVIDPIVTTLEYDVLFVCNVRACIDKMWADVACESCGGSCDLVSKIDDANLAEGLLRGLEAGSVCCEGNEDCINKILNTITQLCSWNKCNC